MAIYHKPTWMDEIVQFLKIGESHANPAKVRKLRIRSAQYTLLDGVLYKGSYTIFLLKWLNEEEAL